VALNFDPFCQDFLLGFGQKLFVGMRPVTTLSPYRKGKIMKYPCTTLRTKQTTAKGSPWNIEMFFSLTCRKDWITIRLCT
jgi:hypothetical protein